MNEERQKTLHVKTEKRLAAEQRVKADEAVQKTLLREIKVKQLENGKAGDKRTLVSSGYKNKPLQAELSTQVVYLLVYLAADKSIIKVGESVIKKSTR